MEAHLWRERIRCIPDSVQHLNQEALYRPMVPDLPFIRSAGDLVDDTRSADTIAPAALCSP